MSIGRGREGDDSPDADGSRTDGPATADRAADDRATSKVHVRRLSVADTLRWSWEVLRQQPELVGVALLANLPTVAVAAGVTRPSPTAARDIATWVWPAYFLHFAALGVATGAFYLTAADAVAVRSRPLLDRVVTATKRVPLLVGTGVLVGALVVVSFLPSLAVTVTEWPAVWVGLLLVVVTVYVFVRLLLAYPACVIDETGPVDSVVAGWNAATGNVGKVFAVGVVYLVVLFASDVVAGLFGGQYDVASSLISATIGSVLLPFVGLALAHLYLEGDRNR